MKKLLTLTLVSSALSMSALAVPMTGPVYSCANETSKEDGASYILAVKSSDKSLTLTFRDGSQTPLTFSKKDGGYTEYTGHTTCGESTTSPIHCGAIETLTVKVSASLLDESRSGKIEVNGVSFSCEMNDMS